MNGTRLEKLEKAAQALYRELERECPGNPKLHSRLVVDAVNDALRAERYKGGAR